MSINLIIKILLIIVSHFLSAPIKKITECNKIYVVKRQNTIINHNNIHNFRDDWLIFTRMLKLNKMLSYMHWLKLCP